MLKLYFRTLAGRSQYNLIFADSFSVDCHLTIHTKMSTGEKAYGCEPCETFIHVNYLRIQTGEKLFKCKIGGKHLIGLVA